MTKHDNEMQRINALVDDELDLSSRLQIEQQMRLDAALAHKVEGLRQLRATIRDGADYHAAPDALRRRLEAAVEPAAVVPARSLEPDSLPAPALPARASVAATAALRRWLGWRPLVASFGLVATLLVAVDLAWLRSARDERVLDDVVASHVRSTLGQHLVDVASSDHHTVKPWLSSKLDFSPPVSELQVPGSVFVGGRVDYLDGHPAAALVYKQGAHVVNSFVWPGNGSDTKPAFSQARGFQTAHWSTGGMTHWVISDVNHDEFATVVAAIRSGDDGR